MKLNKKMVAQLEKSITGILCYEGMVSKAVAENRIDDAFKAMKWFNERADELTALGIEVRKYKVE
jgi:hypothetical protein